MENEEQVNSAFTTPRHGDQQSKRGKAEVGEGVRRGEDRAGQDRTGREGHPRLSLTGFQAALKIGSRKVIQQVNSKEQITVELII